MCVCLCMCVHECTSLLLVSSLKGSSRHQQVMLNELDKRTFEGQQTATQQNPQVQSYTRVPPQINSLQFPHVPAAGGAASPGEFKFSLIVSNNISAGRLLARKIEILLPEHKVCLGRDT